jgi:hypothetical protein
MIQAIATKGMDHTNKVVIAGLNGGRAVLYIHQEEKAREIARLIQQAGHYVRIEAK